MYTHRRCVVLLIVLSFTLLAYHIDDISFFFALTDAPSHFISQCSFKLLQVLFLSQCRIYCAQADSGEYNNHDNVKNTLRANEGTV